MAKTFTFSVDDMVAGWSARDLVNIELIKMADEGLEFACVVCDDYLQKSKMGELEKKHPGTVFDVGIAEPDGVGVGAGLATAGYVTYVTAFGPFLSLRAVDQIHTDVAYNDVPVRLIGTHGGLTSGGGPTHYAIMDAAVMRAIPSMTMCMPSDANQGARLIRASLTYPGPMYIRLPRGEEPLVYADQDYPFEIGKAVVAKEGTDATVIACGSCVHYGVAAAQKLEEEGISVRVLDMHTLKPLDDEAVLAAAKETGVIVTAEDHNVVGGLGDAVASVVAKSGMGIKFKSLGIPDVFASVGYAEDLHPFYGYDPEGIAREIRTMLGKHLPPAVD